ncbi:MAG: ABC transporter permease [Christensenellales bacterium]|jgi:hypothetical protein
MSTKRAVLLLLLALLIGWGAVKAAQTPALYQYAVPMPRATQQAADTKKENEEGSKPQPSAVALHLKSLRDTFTNETDMVSGWAVTTYASGVHMSESNGNTVSARLCGWYGDMHIHPAPVLRVGRLPYREELDAGTPVAVLDERLAIELFRVSDPTGRFLEAGGVQFEVIGVVQHTRTPGEHDAYSAYVPLMAVEKMEVTGQILVVSLQPLRGGGAFSALRTLMEQWLTGGEMYSLPKEIQRTFLPIRYLLVFIVSYLLLILFKLARKLSSGMIAHMKHKLQSRYAISLTPLFLSVGLGILMLYAGLLGLTYLVFSEAIAPVYIFPEWVPAIPVEWSEISKTFWANRTAQNRLLSVRTPETLSLTFWHQILTYACALMAYMLLVPLSRLRHNVSRRIGE